MVNFFDFTNAKKVKKVKNVEKVKKVKNVEKVKKVNKFDKLVDCENKKCEKENKIFNKKFDANYVKKDNKLYNDYESGKISLKEFIKKATKNNDKISNSNETIKLHKCKINKCYKYLKPYLDTYAAKVNYKKKKANYTTEDYIKIFQLIFKRNIKK